MNAYINPSAQPLLAKHQLDSFEALWNLELEPVDEPNVLRGGYSIVCRLELDGQVFYLKRQRNHLTRSLCHPLGEPTFARELRNIQRYQALGIPTIEPAFFAQRKVSGEKQAILLTYALTDWQDLDHWLSRYPELSVEQQVAMVEACADLIARLHQGRLMHSCLYPKHVFLQQQGAGFKACLIDLEKTRAFRLAQQDRVKDLDTLFRRVGQRWGETEMRTFLQRYLTKPYNLEQWMLRLAKRRVEKESRR